MAKKQTPPDPHYKILIIIVAMLLSWKSTTAQSKMDSVKIQTIATYRNSLKAFYNKAWGAERKQYLRQNSKGLITLLPSVGLSFGLPTVSWSANQYFNYKRDKVMVEQSLLSLDDRKDIEYKGLLQELEKRYEIVKVRIDKYYLMQGKEAVQEILYEIKRECCVKNECKPEECLLNELNRLGNKEQLINEKLAVITALKELEILAKYNLPNDSIWYEENENECILDSYEFKRMK